MKDFWAKTIVDQQPGISVRDHCINVGCVAEALLKCAGKTLRTLLPAGSQTLAALHDVGKISTGFQSKCAAWLEQAKLAEVAARQRWKEGSESDHARVSQFYLEQVLEPLGLERWAVAVGVHHGRIQGKDLSPLDIIPEQEPAMNAARDSLLAELASIFGALPTDPPHKKLHDLWCLAGLISVADWIGSNEDFFPAAHGVSLDRSRELAGEALTNIRWNTGRMHDATFARLFDNYTPKPLQAAMREHATAPGLFIVEGPMGCGKTEAALWAAHRLIVTGANDGLYFALPTQVTSNRIHQRVAPFLMAALDDVANFRLAHSASWLEDKQTWLLHPSDTTDANVAQHVREGRSWFASSKHAMLARYGVGTVDQALQGVVAVKHFFVRRFGLAGKVVVLDEVHSYDVYTGTLITQLIAELLVLGCTVIVLSATLTVARRQELVEAAGGDASQAASVDYPLVTVVKAGAAPVEVPFEKTAPRTVKLCNVSMTDDEVLSECIERAESGQHVLYLRNTVVQAQDTCRKACGGVRAERTEVGLLHSRFPFFRRQELETYWLRRIGKQRDNDGKGSLLIATQVVEQSVDIDLDFIVSELAPTDMLLQRMGRLWRHERQDRLASEPEFWINAPVVDREAGAKTLSKAFGKSGLVYAPYVLLRTAEVFAQRESISLPDDIRSVLEQTYAERGAADEPVAWRELCAEVEAVRESLAGEAAAAMRVLNRQSEDDNKERLTRRKGAPTRDVVLLKRCELITRDTWQLTMLDTTTVTASAYNWSIEVARAIHRNLARAPLYTVPGQEMPLWLRLHTHGQSFWALVADDGACEFRDAEGPSPLAYHPTFGLHTLTAQPQPCYTEDDDEWD